jgi:hypothetical protein
MHVTMHSRSFTTSKYALCKSVTNQYKHVLLLTPFALAIVNPASHVGRDIPDNAPMPFKNEWRVPVRTDGKIDRRLYETAITTYAPNS